MGRSDIKRLRRRRNPQLRPQYSSLRAFVPDYGPAATYFCQSRLEEEFFILFGFLKGSEVDEVRRYTCKIKYINSNGRAVSHSPDAFIATSQRSILGQLKIITEVKHQRNLQRRSTVSFRRIREHALAGLEHAHRQGTDWTYAIFTEEQIETPLLSSVKFLTNYANQSYLDRDKAKEIRGLVRAEPGLKVKHVAERLGRESLPTLYHLFYWHKLEFDYRVSLRSERQRLDASVYPSLGPPVSYFSLIKILDIKDVFLK